jgi:chaperonin GroEL (HSP60 family)
MLVSSDGDVTVTNDGATILDNMEVSLLFSFRFTFNMHASD